MFGLENFFKWDYLFAPQPTVDSNLVTAIASFFAFFLIASALVWLLLTPKARRFPPLMQVRSRLTQAFFVTSLVGLLLVFFRWEQIPYLGSRIWLFVWLLATLLWFGRLLIYLLKKFPEERRIFETKRQYERYLPKSKNKN